MKTILLIDDYGYFKKGSVLRLLENADNLIKEGYAIEIDDTISIETKELKIKNGITYHKN